MSKTTCGPLYQQALEAFTDMTPEQVELFASGFVVGQAEKVYLGACSAAMFRPSAEHYGWMRGVTAEAAEIYDLIRREGIGGMHGEIWLFRDEHAVAWWDRLSTEGVPNSMSWHSARGMLCGVPMDERDFEFHEHPGYNEPCDQRRE